MSGAEIARVQHLIDLRRWPEAAERVTGLLTEDPHSARLHGLHAEVLIGLERPAEALDAADRAVAAAPEHEGGHRLRSVVLHRLGRSQDATDAAWQAVGLAPSHWATHAQYALVATPPYRGRPTAWEAALRGVQLGPHEPDAHVAIAQTAAARLDHETAVRAYREVLAIDPTHALARNNLTVLESRAGLVRSARGIAEALRLDPQDPAFHGNVDWIVSRFLLHLYAAALITLFIGVALTRTGPGPPDRSLATFLVAGLLVAVMVTYTVVVWRAVPSGFRRYAVTRALHSWHLIYLGVLALIVLGAVLWVCVVPGGAVDGPHLLRPLGIGAVIGIVIYFSRRH